MQHIRSNPLTTNRVRPVEGAWIRDGLSGLCGVCESTTAQTVFARTLAGTPFTARTDDVRVLSPDADAVHTPPAKPTTTPGRRVRMSRLPQVHEGQSASITHMAQLAEPTDFPARAPIPEAAPLDRRTHLSDPADRFESGPAHD